MSIYSDMYEETLAKYKEDVKAFEATFNEACIRKKLYVTEECTDQTAVEKMHIDVKEFFSSHTQDPFEMSNNTSNGLTWILS